VSEFKRIILVRYGEIMLKGLNRHVFEDKLVSNIRRVLKNFPASKVSALQGRVFVEPREPRAPLEQHEPYGAFDGNDTCSDYPFELAVEKLKDIFGVVSVSPAFKIDSDIDQISECAKEVVREAVDKSHFSMRHSLRQGSELSFKVETKRGDKTFPMTSPEISIRVGGDLAEAFPWLTVDVNNPELTVHVEVRESSYVYSDIIKGYGGLPLGTNGKAALLLSGGIDSPVAGFMMAKRGVEIEAIHFFSFPYTGERSKEKVVSLAKTLAGYVYRIKLHVVPFTDIQIAIRDNCQQDYMTIIMRRAMMMTSEMIAVKNGASALITGESMGQVASQTMQGLNVTNAVVKMPVFRPLIGMDKNEIVELARRIGTFDTSILPYDDCCTLFTPKHPRTKPRIISAEHEEQKIDIVRLIKEAVDATESQIIYSD